MLLVNNKKYLKSVKLKYSELSTISKTKELFYKQIFLLEKTIYNSNLFPLLYFPLIFLKLIFKIFKIDFHIPNVNLKRNKQNFDFKLPNFFKFLIYKNLLFYDEIKNKKNKSLKRLIKKINERGYGKSIPKVYYNEDLFICSNRI